VVFLFPISREFAVARIGGSGIGLEVDPWSGGSDGTLDMRKIRSGKLLFGGAAGGRLCVS
jgi:hypothetical protein